MASGLAIAFDLVFALGFAFHWQSGKATVFAFETEKGFVMRFLTDLALSMETECLKVIVMESVPAMV